jgi:hypothetical protein
VVLDRHAVLGLDAHGRLRERARGIAAAVGRRILRLQDCAALALGFEVGDMRLRLVFDADERSGKPRDLELLRKDQRHRLSAEADLLVIKRTERRAVRRDFIFVFFVR